MKILKLFPSHEFKAQMLLHNVPPSYHVEQVMSTPCLPPARFKSEEQRNKSFVETQRRSYFTELYVLERTPQEKPLCGHEKSSCAFLRTFTEQLRACVERSRNFFSNELLKYRTRVEFRKFYELDDAPSFPSPLVSAYSGKRSSVTGRSSAANGVRRSKSRGPRHNLRPLEDQVDKFHKILMSHNNFTEKQIRRYRNHKKPPAEKEKSASAFSLKNFFSTESSFSH